MMESAKDVSVIVASYEGLLTVYTLSLYNEVSKGSKKIAAKLAVLFNAHDHSSPVRCCSCGESGLVATGGADEIIQVYDVMKKTELATLTHHEGTVTSVEWINNDEYLLSTGEDGLICVWDSRTWQLKYLMGKYKSPVTCFSIHPSSLVALSAGKDKTLRTWNLKSGKNAYTTNLKFVCEEIFWSPGSKYYILLSQSNIYIYYSQSTLLAMSSAGSGSINDISFLTEEFVCVGDQSHDVKLVNIEEKQTRTLIPSAHGSRVKCLQFVADLGALITASSEGTIKVWNVELTKLSNSDYTPDLLTEHNSGCRITCMSTSTVRHGTTEQKKKDARVLIQKCKKSTEKLLDNQPTTTTLSKQSVKREKPTVAVKKKIKKKDIVKKKSKVKKPVA